MARQGNTAGGGKAFLRDVIRRTGSDDVQAVTGLQDLIDFALEYVSEDDDARRLVHDVAKAVVARRDTPKTKKAAERRLVKRIRAEGSRMVFEAAYKECGSGWRSYARRIMLIKDPTFSAEDLVNQAVTAAWRARPDFTAIAAVNKYVRDAIRTTYGKWVANLLRLPVSLTSLDVEEVPLDPPGRDPSPDRRAFHSERAEQLHELLAQHTRPEDLDAFILNEVYGWKAPDIAERQRVTARTVYDRIRKVRELIRDHLEEWG